MKNQTTERRLFKPAVWPALAPQFVRTHHTRALLIPPLRGDLPRWGRRSVAVLSLTERLLLLFFSAGNAKSDLYPQKSGRVLAFPSGEGGER